MIKANKYDIERVERDFEYYQKTIGGTNSSIYFMLKNKYKNRLEYAQQRLREEIQKEESEEKGEEK